MSTRSNIIITKKGTKHSDDENFEPVELMTLSSMDFFNTGFLPPQVNCGLFITAWILGVFGLCV